VNVSGILVVFSGVILYKIVFHLDKRDHSEAVHEYVEGDDDDDDDGIGNDEDDDGDDNDDDDNDDDDDGHETGLIETREVV